MNCGRNARKKIDSFGLRMLIRNPVTMTRRLERPAAGRGIDRERARLAQRLPGHIEQIEHAAPFQRRKRQRAGVQHGGEPQHRGRHVRHDPERAAEGGRDRGPRLASTPPPACRARRCRGTRPRSARSAGTKVSSAGPWPRMRHRPAISWRDRSRKQHAGTCRITKACPATPRPPGSRPATSFPPRGSRRAAPRASTRIVRRPAASAAAVCPR